MSRSSQQTVLTSPRGGIELTRASIPDASSPTRRCSVRQGFLAATKSSRAKAIPLPSTLERQVCTHTVPISTQAKSTRTEVSRTSFSKLKQATKHSPPQLQSPKLSSRQSWPLNVPITNRLRKKKSDEDRVKNVKTPHKIVAMASNKTVISERLVLPTRLHNDSSPRTPSSALPRTSPQVNKPLPTTPRVHRKPLDHGEDRGFDDTVRTAPRDTLPQATSEATPRSPQQATPGSRITRFASRVSLPTSQHAALVTVKRSPEPKYQAKMGGRSIPSSPESTIGTTDDDQDEVKTPTDNLNPTSNVQVTWTDQIPLRLNTASTKTSPQLASAGHSPKVCNSLGSVYSEDNVTPSAHRNQSTTITKPSPPSSSRQQSRISKIPVNYSKLVAGAEVKDVDAQSNTKGSIKQVRIRDASSSTATSTSQDSKTKQTKTAIGGALKKVRSMLDLRRSMPQFVMQSPSLIARSFVATTPPTTASPEVAVTRAGLVDAMQVMAGAEAEANHKHRYLTMAKTLSDSKMLAKDAEIARIAAEAAAFDAIQQAELAHKAVEMIENAARRLLYLESRKFF